MLINSEIEIKDCITLLGMKVEKIKESSSKTPDFLVKCEKYKYLVELKEKFTNKEFLKIREQMLLDGDIFEENYPAGRKKIISGVIRAACKQFTSSEITADFNIVWLHAKGHNPDFQIYDFESTLYGYEVIVEWGKQNGFSGFCYHFGHSDFYNHRNVLDGAVVSTTNEMKFCINACSPKYHLLKESGFRKAFEDGVLDPIDLEEEGQALIVNSDVNRNDENAVMEYVIKKYKLQKAMKMPMQQISATVALPNKYKI
jgi:hypothetical protein